MLSEIHKGVLQSKGLNSRKQYKFSANKQEQ